MIRFSIIAMAAIAASMACNELLAKKAGYSTIGATIHGCDIKGNISLNTGERIYHVPGQEHYPETIVTPSRGERWFCSEEAASAAGWRKAKSRMPQ